MIFASLFTIWRTTASACVTFLRRAAVLVISLQLILSQSLYAQHDKLAPDTMFHNDPLAKLTEEQVNRIVSQKFSDDEINQAFDEAIKWYNDFINRSNSPISISQEEKKTAISVIKRYWLTKKGVSKYLLGTIMEAYICARFAPGSSCDSANRLLIRLAILFGETSGTNREIGVLWSIAIEPIRLGTNIQMANAIIDEIESFLALRNIVIVDRIQRIDAVADIALTALKNGHREERMRETVRAVRKIFNECPNLNNCNVDLVLAYFRDTMNLLMKHSIGIADGEHILRMTANLLEGINGEEEIRKVLCPSYLVISSILQSGGNAEDIMCILGSIVRCIERRNARSRLPSTNSILDYYKKTIELLSKNVAPDIGVLKNGVSIINEVMNDSHIEEMFAFFEDFVKAEYKTGMPLEMFYFALEQYALKVFLLYRTRNLLSVRNYDQLKDVRLIRLLDEKNIKLTPEIVERVVNAPIIIGQIESEIRSFDISTLKTPSAPYDKSIAYNKLHNLYPKIMRHVPYRGFIENPIVNRILQGEDPAQIERELLRREAVSAVIVKNSFSIPELLVLREDLAGDPISEIRAGAAEESEAAIEDRIRARILDHVIDITVYTAEKLVQYGNEEISVEGRALFVKGMRSHARYSFKYSYPDVIKGYSLDELMNDIGISVDEKNAHRIDIIEQLALMGYTIDGENRILSPADMTTSVFRGSLETDNLTSQFCTFNFEHAVRTYAGGEMTYQGEGKATGKKSLQEIDYSLLCYEGVNSKTADTDVVAAFIFGKKYQGTEDDIPSYSYKRTLSIDGNSGLEIFENVVDKQKKERIAEEVLYRIFNLMIEGKINKGDLEQYIGIMKEMLSLLQELYNWEYFTAMYGYMSDEYGFFDALRAAHASSGISRGRLIEIMNDAKEKQCSYLERTLSTEKEIRHAVFLRQLRSQSKRWKDEDKNIIDYLKFKKEIRSRTYANDENRPDILREVERIMGNAESVVERVPAYREYTFNRYVEWTRNRLAKNRELQAIKERLQGKMPSDEDLRKLRIRREWFLRIPSTVHGIMHESRVLVLGNMIMGLIGNISDLDRQSVSLSAVTHDVRREDDDTDADHGGRSAKWVRDSLRNYFPDANADIVAEINKGHVPEDKGDMTQLLRIFKDADALDRWRIGDLDKNLLRFSQSKELAPVAKLLYEISTELNVRFGVSEFESVILAGQIMGIIESDSDIRLPGDLSKTVFGEMPAAEPVTCIQENPADVAV